MTSLKRTVLLLFLAALAKADVLDISVKNSSYLTDDIQNRLKGRTTKEQKDILLDHFNGLSKILEATSFHKLYPTKVAHRTDGNLANLFSKERRALHAKIFKAFLGEDCDKKPGPHQKPKLILTAGSPGSGKTTVMMALEKKGLFKKENFVYLDPDEIRGMLPEYQVWTNTFSNNADVQEKISRFTQAEANYLTDAIYAEALKSGKNIVRDGTLRNTVFFSKLVSDANVSGYSTGIVHIESSKATAQERVEARAKLTGRRVNKEFLDLTSSDVISLSVNRLRNLSYFYIKVDNESSPELRECFINSSCSDKNTSTFQSEYKNMSEETDTGILALLDKLDCQPQTSSSVSSKDSPSDVQEFKVKISLEKLGAEDSSLAGCLKALHTVSSQEQSKMDSIGHCTSETGQQEIEKKLSDLHNPVAPNKAVDRK